MVGSVNDELHAGRDLAELADYQAITVELIVVRDV
jgi:hypothetical protein